MLYMSCAILLKLTPVESDVYIPRLHHQYSMCQNNSYYVNGINYGYISIPDKYVTFYVTMNHDGTTQTHAYSLRSYISNGSIVTVIDGQNAFYSAQTKFSSSGSIN